MSKNYPSDLTDEQWTLLEPHIPPSKHGGRPRALDIRTVVNGIFYRNRSGCQWRMLPKDYPPWETVYYYFSMWRDNGTWERINQALREQVRVAEGHEPTPSACSIDSQTVKNTEQGGEVGFDPARKVTGNSRKRHIIVDTMGLVLLVMVTSGAVQDYHAAPKLFAKLNRTNYPRLIKIWADSKYHNYSLYDYIRDHVEGNWSLDIVNRPPDQKGWVTLPHRWVSERTFAWIGRYRGHSKDYERLTESSESMIYVSMTQLMLRRLRPSPEQNPPFKYRSKTA